MDAGRLSFAIYSCQENDTNEYPNIFVSKKLTRTNIRIYSYPKNDTKEYPNKYSDQKYSNIRIYSSHSGLGIYENFFPGGQKWVGGAGELAAHEGGVRDEHDHPQGKGQLSRDNIKKQSNLMSTLLKYDS